MTLEGWGGAWRDAIAAELRRGDSGAFAGRIATRIVPRGLREEAGRGGALRLEGGVLVLADLARFGVVLAALPAWSGPLLAAGSEFEQNALGARGRSVALSNDLQMLTLTGPDGAAHTAYVRRLAAPAAQLLADPDAGFTPGADAAERPDPLIGEATLTRDGEAEVTEFLDAVAAAAAVFLPAEEDVGAAPSYWGAAPGESDPGPDPDPAPVRFPESAPAAVPPVMPAAVPAAAATAAAPAVAPAAAPAAARRRRGGAAGWVIGGVGALLLLVAGVLIAVGFAGGYTHEVVDQPAQEETTREEPTGLYDVSETDRRICGNDEDYFSCVNQHVAVFNSSCADVPLTQAGDEICTELEGFIEDTKASYAECGADCRTVAGDDGLWGWGYLEAEAEMHEVVDQEARPAVTHTERCDFVLGAIEIGSCPR